MTVAAAATFPRFVGAVEVLKRPPSLGWRVMHNVKRIGRVLLGLVATAVTKKLLDEVVDWF